MWERGMKEFTLKLIAILGALFIGYLWSGGVWSYDGGTRYNKITGNTEYLYDREWLSADDVAKHEEEFHKLHGDPTRP